MISTRILVAVVLVFFMLFMFMTSMARVPIAVLLLAIKSVVVAILAALIGSRVPLPVGGIFLRCPLVIVRMVGVINAVVVAVMMVAVLRLRCGEESEGE